VIREMAKNLGVSDKGSKLDIINRIKSALNIEGTFLKLFSKMWGGSGKNMHLSILRVLFNVVNYLNYCFDINFLI
jgi:hypothetical protein